MENSLNSSGGCSTEIPKKTKCLDLQTIYNSKGFEEEPSKQRKRGKGNLGKVGVGNKKKKRSVKEFSLGRIDQGGKKKRKISDEGDGSQLGSRVSTDMNGGLSGVCYKNGLNGVPFSFGGNGNVLRIPKRPRCTTSRRKFEGDRNGKVCGSSMIFHVGRLNAELKKAESSGSSGAEAGQDKRGVELTTVEVGGSKVQGKRAVSDVKESEPSARDAEECSHVVASNGDVPPKKRRSTFRKRKDLTSVGEPSVKKVEPTVDNSGNTSDGLRDNEGFHVIANNGDVSSRKRRSNFRKRKDLASVGEPAVKKVEPAVDNSGNNSDGLRDKEGFHVVANNGDVASRKRRSSFRKRKDLASIGEPSAKKVEPTVDNSGNTCDGLGDKEGIHVVAINGDVSSKQRRSNFRKRKDLALVGEPSVKKVEPTVDNSVNTSDGLGDKEGFHDVANNGDVFSRKRRSNFRKRKDLAVVGGHSAKKVEPSLDNSGNLFEGLRDEDDNEENLEQNAARMLSSRFDPRCTGFSSISNSTRAFHNGASFSVSSGPEFVCSRSDSLAGVELESADAASRKLRPRKQHGQKKKPRKRRHFYEIVTSNFDAQWFLNRKIKVFWPLDENWYYGLVNDYDPETKLHHVKYDDRDEEWINLQQEKFKLLLLPSEVPGRRRRRRASMSEKRVNKCKAHSNADDDSSSGTFLDSEPIISWLIRSSRRIKSSSSNCFKKQKTLQVSSSAGPSPAPVETAVDTNTDVDGSRSDCASALSDSSTDGDVGPSAKDGSKSDCASTLPDRSIDMDPPAENGIKSDRVSALPDRSTDGERIENSLMGSPSSSTATNCIVYVRKRLRNKVEVSNVPKSCRSRFATFVSLAHDESLLAAVESNNIFWSTDDQGLIKLAISPTECKTLSFKLCSTVLPFFEHSFKAEQRWLSHALLLPHYGTTISAWLEVVLEILFVDNTVGLRFLLFEGCLKDVILLFSLILTVFNEPHGDWIFCEMQLPITSIRFKLSAKHDRWKEQVFTFYNFSTLRRSQWLYLDSKLQRHCLFSKKLPLSDCTYDNLKSLEGGSHQLHMPCPDAGPSQFQKRSLQSILPVGVPREHASTRMRQSAFTSAIQLTKFPAFAVSFTAAPTFFLNLHLKLLMDRAIASVSLQDKSLCPSEDAGVANQPFSADFRGDDFCSENNCWPIVPGISWSETSKEKISEIAPYAATRPRIEFAAGTDDRVQVPQEVACAQSAIDMSVSTGLMDFKKTATDTTIKPCRQDSDEQELEQIVASSAPVSKTVSSPGSFSKMNSYGLAGLNVQLPSLYASDKASDGGMIISDVQSPNLTRLSSSMFHDSIVQSSTPCGDLSPIWRDGRSTLIQGGFGNGPKKPRTQVQYSLPPGAYHLSSNHKNHNQTAPSYKRIRKSNKRRICEGFRDSQKNIELLACDANVLVSLRERGWRECGARVVLELTDHNEWTLAVKFSGITKYSHKVSQILQPGSTNRYTHAMMWKGGKDWMLEFPDRSQWILFKEIYEECHNRNIRAASVKNIPIPGVRLIEESEDCANEPLFVQHSPRYFHQLESDVEMALNPSRVFYDMDSDDEQWISVTRNSSCTDENNSNEIADELFEKTMDMLEKFAYTQRREEFTDEELEELVPGFHSIEILKAIYQHWQQKRRRRGMPLIRHFQAPLWEQYQQQVKLWEEAVARANTGACKEKTVSMEKPPMFAFCLKPRGLEVISRGSKQRSHRRFPTYGHYQSLPVDQDGLHTHGRRLNGFNEEKSVFSDRSNEFPDASPSFHNSTRSLSPGDGGVNSLVPFNGDVSEWNHHPKFNRNKQRKNGALASPNSCDVLVPYHQKTSGMRNGVHKLDMDLREWPSQKTTQRHEGNQTHEFGLFDGSDYHEFRLMDAKGEAQQARKVAKLKRERAQRLLYRADLAVHKAAVALMTAEAIKASFDGSGADT